MLSKKAADEVDRVGDPCKRRESRLAPVSVVVVVLVSC